MDRPFPSVPKELLDKLETLYPDRLPQTLIPAEEVARRVGQQDVMRKLRSEFTRQTEPKK